MFRHDRDGIGRRRAAMPAATAARPGEGRGALRAAAPAQSLAARLRAPVLLCVTAFFALALLLGLTAPVAVATPDPNAAIGAAHAQVLLAEQQAAAQAAAPVWVTRVGGVIDPSLAGFLAGTMKKAAAANAAALVVEIDTPGGLDTSMRQIIQAELAAPIPIIFYVYPQGARAASAGLYIVEGSDVAAMAPNTNIGAATPVTIGGGTITGTEQTKVINDAVAYIRGLATSHNRNADWAEQAVRQAVSVASDEALRLKVVDFVAPDLPSLLKAIDGHVTTPKNLTLHTSGAPIIEVSMGFFQQFLHAVDAPSFAYIFLVLGILGLAVGFVVPGSHHIGAIVGAVALVLAFYSLQVLPVNWAGLALIVVAFILFVVEIKAQTHGILGFLGAAALIVGGILMFNTGAAYARINLVVVIVAAVIIVGFFLFVGRKARTALLRPHATGMESMVGRTGVVISPLTPLGLVRVNGELWKARSEGGDLLKDETVEVVGTEGLTLIVRRCEKPCVVSDSVGTSTPTSKEGT